MKTGIFDIETTGFNADFGRMICAVVKDYNEKVPVVVVADTLDDRAAVIKLRDILESFDILVAHYGKGFDIPFLQSRLLILGERRMSSRFFVDTYYVSKNHFKKAISRKSLESLADVLDLPEDKQKIKVRRKTWNDARDGVDDARKKVVKRCIGDVFTLEAVYDKLRPWVDNLKKFS